MDRLVGAAREAYDALVRHEARFHALFRSCTQVEILDELNIASRPAARAGRGEIADLRAIPWVFAWMQTRIGLPSWYGAGTALAAGSRGLQHEMWSAWPFFRNLITTLESALSACDLRIGRRYLELWEGDGRREAERLWTLVHSEYERCVAAVLDVTGTATRCGRRPRRSSGPPGGSYGSMPSRTCRWSCSSAIAPATGTPASPCWRPLPGSRPACERPAEPTPAQERGRVFSVS
jgi:phosphoenolpyruvate carboxylase